IDGYISENSIFDTHHEYFDSKELYNQIIKDKNIYGCNVAKKKFEKDMINILKDNSRPDDSLLYRRNVEPKSAPLREKNINTVRSTKISDDMKIFNEFVDKLFLLDENDKENMQQSCGGINNHL
ncbi:MAG: hypothetical protein MHPSP_004380, partial [Paramarteilia canceri]